MVVFYLYHTVVAGHGKLKFYCSFCMTELNSIKQILSQLRLELITKFHVSSIGLFKSVVRADFSPSSDIDSIVEFSKPIGIEFINLADLIKSKLKKC